jgi:hypothetical protein
MEGDFRNKMYIGGGGGHHPHPQEPPPIQF